jgi:hypothetical protein
MPSSQRAPEMSHKIIQKRVVSQFWFKRRSTTCGATFNSANFVPNVLSGRPALGSVLPCHAPGADHCVIGWGRK